MTPMYQLTKLLGASVLEDLFVGWVESNTPHHITYLCSIDQTVSTVPEVEQVKHILHVCITILHSLLMYPKTLHFPTVTGGVAIGAGHLLLFP